MNALVFRSPHLLLTLTALIWGGNAVAGKFAVGHVSPMILTMSRWGVALVVVAYIARNHIRQDWLVIRKNWLYLLLMGGVGYTCFNYGLYSALQYISAINVALEQSAMPLVIFILNFAIFRTRVTRFQIVGYTLTLTGVLITVSGGDLLGLFTGGGSGFNPGDLFMFVAAICFAGYSVALRAKPEMHWLSFLACLAAAAFVVAIAGAALEVQSGNALFPTTIQGVLVVLFAGLAASLLAQGLFIKGVEAFGANIAGLYINLVPVFGALLAVVLLGEKFHLFHAVAFVLVVGGILIAQKKKPDPAQSGSTPTL